MGSLIAHCASPAFHARPLLQRFLYQMLQGIAYCHSHRWARPDALLHWACTEHAAGACYCLARPLLVLPLTGAATVCARPAQHPTPRPQAAEPADRPRFADDEAGRLWAGAGVWHPCAAVHTRGAHGAAARVPEDPSRWWLPWLPPLCLPKRLPSHLPSRLPTRR